MLCIESIYLSFLFFFTTIEVFLPTENEMKSTFQRKAVKMRDRRGKKREAEYCAAHDRDKEVQPRKIMNKR